MKNQFCWDIYLLCDEMFQSKHQQKCFTTMRPEMGGPPLYWFSATGGYIYGCVRPSNLVILQIIRIPRLDLWSIKHVHTSALLCQKNADINVLWNCVQLFNFSSCDIYPYFVPNMYLSCVFHGATGIFDEALVNI